MVDSIQPSPRDRKLYEQQYRDGVALFQKALDQYQQSDNQFQKAEFKGVMDKAFQVLQDTAFELARGELKKQNEKISKDYAAMQEGDPQAPIHLHNDLNQAKRKV